MNYEAELAKLSENLQHQSSELYHIKAVLNNLCLVQTDQQNQKLERWVRYTGEMIKDLRSRAEELELSVERLTKRQAKLYNAAYAIA